MSDIHGHAENFLRVLQKAGYGGDDVLVIAGDLIDKGPESLRTVRMVMALAEKRPVYFSMGNVDFSRMEMLLDDTGDGSARFSDFIHWVDAHMGGQSLLVDFLREAGIAVAQVTAGNAAQIQKRLRAQFSAEI